MNENLKSNHIAKVSLGEMSELELKSLSQQIIRES